MPDCITSQGQGAPGKMEALGVITCEDQPTHRLGIIDYLCTKGKWWALLMSRSMWPQQSNLPQSSQDAYCRRSCTQIHKFTWLCQAHCMSWLLVNSPWWRIKPLNYLQKPLWEVPLPASSLWCGLFTRHLPEEEGPVPQRVPWMYWNHWWHHHTWSYWDRTWCLSAEPHVGHLQVWSCVQPTENAHKGPSHKLLWLPIWCQWCPPRSGEGQSCTCSPSTHKCHWTPRVPQHGDIPQPLHLWPILSDHSSVRTPEKRCRLHLKCQLWVKQAIVSNTTLRYFDPLLPVTIQVDASQIGLGTAFLQDNKPIAFASKALTDAECRYANIERERC